MPNPSILAGWEAIEMGTSKAAIVESISSSELQGFSSRRRDATPSERLESIKAIAGALLAEAESLDRDHALAEALVAPVRLDTNSGIDFYAEVRGFETRLIRLALQHTRGNQTRAARILSLGTTTLHSKIKRYALA